MARWRGNRVLILLVVLVVATLVFVVERITSPAHLFDAFPAWSPDGRLLAHECYWRYRLTKWYGSGEEFVDPLAPVDEWFEICVTDLDEHRTWRVTRNEQSDTRPSWSSDGSYLAFIQEDKLYVSTSDGAEMREVSSGKKVIGIGEYSWSPRGTFLSFVAAGTGDEFSLNADLFIIDLSNMRLRQLTDWEGDEFEPTWSPASDQVAFVWFSKGIQRNTARIYVIDTVTGNSEQIVEAFVGGSTGPLAISNLVWSPDGKTLAFVGARNPSLAAVYLIDLDTHRLVQLTPLMRGLSSLAWSPDASQLAYISFGHDGEEVFVMSRDGTDAEQLTKSRDFDDNSISFRWAEQQRLTWSPDGQYLAFVRAMGENLNQRVWVLRIDGSSPPQMVTGQ